MSSASHRPLVMILTVGLSLALCAPALFLRTSPLAPGGEHVVFATRTPTVLM